MTIASFEYWQEYYRVEATLWATEEGMFKELPLDLLGGTVQIAVVYRICFVDDAGRIRVQDFANMPAMDKERRIGGPVKLDGIEWFVEPGDGTSALETSTRYSHILLSGDPGKLAMCDAMHIVAKERDQFGP